MTEQEQQTQEEQIKLPEEQGELTEEQKKEVHEQLQAHFNKFKKRMKAYSKSELIAFLWEQGIQYRQLQELAQQLDRALKTGESNEQPNT